jgi:hypothetical protein
LKCLNLRITLVKVWRLSEISMQKLIIDYFMVHWREIMRGERHAILSGPFPFLILIEYFKCWWITQRNSEIGFIMKFWIRKMFHIVQGDKQFLSLCIEISYCELNLGWIIFLMKFWKRISFKKMKLLTFKLMWQWKNSTKTKEWILFNYLDHNFGINCLHIGSSSRRFNNADSNHQVRILFWSIDSYESLEVIIN